MPNVDPILNLPVYCLNPEHPEHNDRGVCIDCGHKKFFPEGMPKARGCQECGQVFKSVNPERKCPECRNVCGDCGEPCYPSGLCENCM